MELTTAESQTKIGENGDTAELESGQAIEVEAIDHYPDKRVLKLAQSLWSENNLEAYKDGSIKLHNLSLETVKMLLGIGHNEEAVDTGFRFSSTQEDGTTITSNPNFNGGQAIPLPEDADQITSGKVEVEMKTHWELIVVISCIKLRNSDIASDNDLSYSITIMPAPELTQEEYLSYYNLLAENIHKTNQDSGINN